MTEIERTRLRYITEKTLDLSRYDGEAFSDTYQRRRRDREDWKEEISPSEVLELLNEREILAVQNELLLNALAFCAQRNQCVEIPVNGKLVLYCTDDRLDGSPGYREFWRADYNGTQEYTTAREVIEVALS